MYHCQLINLLVSAGSFPLTAVPVPIAYALICVLEVGAVQCRQDGSGFWCGGFR